MRPDICRGENFQRFSHRVGCQSSHSQHPKIIDRWAPRLTAGTEGRLTLIPPGGAFHTSGTINGQYYYPKDPGAVSLKGSVSAGRSNPSPAGQGEISALPRGLKEGEIGEWILLDAVNPMHYDNLPTISFLIFQTPASCASIALHNLFPGEIDLVVRIQGESRNIVRIFLPIPFHCSDFRA